MSCECTEPGWCERHRCQKTPHWHKLCRRRADYFRLWEEGRGPGQNTGNSQLAATPMTVLMVTHNRLDYTRLAINALLASDHPRLEVVVWDNASTDGTRQWLTERLGRNSRVDLIFSARNVGVVRPMNVIWSTARTPLVAKVDNDTLIPRDLLSRLSEFLDAAPSAGVVSGCHFRPDDVGTLVDVECSSPWERQICRQVHVGGCAVMMRKSLFNLFGPISCGQQGHHRPYLEAGWTQYQERLDRAGYINGYPLPLHFVDHMEDTRSEYCLLTDEHEQYKQSMRFMSLAECTDRLYRKPRNRRFRHPERLDVASSFNETSTPLVTLFVPLLDSVEHWSRLQSFLERQTWPRDQTKLLLMTRDNDREFSTTVRRWLAGSDYPDVCHTQLPVTTSDDIRGLAARAVERMQNELATEFVWMLDAGVEPPDDTCARLLASFDDRTVSVSAVDSKQCVDPQGNGSAQRDDDNFDCAVIRSEPLCRNRLDTAEHPFRLFSQRMRNAELAVRCDSSCRFERCAVHEDIDATD